MAASRNQFISPAEAARRLGVSVRALRLYERRGLLAPLRTSNGWRAYGPNQIARIQEILALKGLGLSLVRIGEVFTGRGEVGLDRVLAAQQGLLAARRGQLDRALALVGAARAKIAAGASITANDLIDLIRDTTLFAKGHAAWGEALADPELAPKLPIGPAELAFLGQAGRSWQTNRPRA